MRGLDIRSGFAGGVFKKTTNDTSYSQALLYARQAGARVPAGTSVCAGRFSPQVPVSFTPPAYGRGRPSAALGSIHFGCNELDVVIGQLKVAQSKLANSPAAKAVVASIANYLDEFDVYFRVSYSSETCKNVVDSGTALLTQANGYLPPGSALNVSNPDIKPNSILDALGSLKWIAIAGAAIAGIYLIAPWVRR